MGTEDALLELKNLKVHFQTPSATVRAVDGVDVQVGRGQIVGLVGESGSGKSTLARAIVGLLPGRARVIDGSIIFNGLDLTKCSEREMRSIRGREISMVFQDPMSYLNPVMRIGDQIAEAVHSTKDKDKVTEIILELLERVGVPKSRDLMHDYPYQLSGGMRQRILLAMAIASKPDLLIADEPTTALDVTVQAQILELIKEITRKMNNSVLLITHDLGVVAETCDVVYVMYAGKIAEHGDVRTVFGSPMHPYTSALLSSALSIERFNEKIVGIPGEVPDLISPPVGCRFQPRCPLAKSICLERDPIGIDPTPGHRVYCWNYVEEELSLQN